MTRLKSVLISGFLIGCSFTTIQAQSLDEFLRFSQPEQGASTRFKALGNAQTALGGDLSSISGNPAGLGFFAQSDIGLSFNFSSDVNKALYFGSNSTNTKDKFAINQAGAVFNFPTQKARGSNLSSGWLNFNVGIGYHRTANFNSTLGFTGINDESSYGDFMALEDGNLFGDIGWNFGMVDENANGQLVSMTTPNNVQTAYYREGGGQSETNLSFGANYSNRLYIGGSVGFTRINHQMNRLFMEDGTIEDYGYIYSLNPDSRFVNPANAEYGTYNPLLESDYEFDDEYWSNTTGNGINAKLGVIFKPVPQFQIGLTAATPTWYSLTNDYEDYFGITNYLTDGTDSPTEDPGDPIYYDYDLRTPYKLSAGLAYIFGGGLLSADVDYVDYASMSMSSTNAADDGEFNDGIKATYAEAVNFRVGGEYLIAPQLLVRAGYGFTGNPYKDDAIDYTGKTVSGGLGYRINNVYVDLTYQNFQRNYSMIPYLLDDAAGLYSPVVDVKNQRHNVLLSVGVKF
ncbi:OmpP1/FadL family transporter [Parapedobacter tibetensis]|uniref:OmpP1/FadL family transporter n=1 Tax=Parapedobacter tibetensis TaxID=2972951 RepID=UPI00214DD0FD|nr:hypothetical protein [Parapedobacter tibetensis]